MRVHAGKRRINHIKKSTHYPPFAIRPAHMPSQAIAPAQVSPNTLLPHPTPILSQPCCEVCGAAWTSDVHDFRPGVAPRRGPCHPPKSRASVAGNIRAPAATGSGRRQQYFAPPHPRPPAVRAVSTTQMDGGGARASWAIAPAMRLRGAAKARTRDRGRPRDRWNAEGSDHGENKSSRLRRRATREISFSTENGSNRSRDWNSENGLSLHPQALPSSRRRRSADTKHTAGAWRRSCAPRTKTDPSSKGGLPTSPRRGKRANVGGGEEALHGRRH